MEDSGSLDPNNPLHLKALHHVYLPVVNERLDTFRRGWNNHKLRTENHKTPNQVWLSGMIDNMASQYTAPRELFEQSCNLNESMVTALSGFGLSLEDLGQDPTPQIDDDALSDAQKAQVYQELARISTNKEKLLKCIEILGTFQ